MTKSLLGLLVSLALLASTIGAQTSGWVAIGLGSNHMDGSYMVMGYEAGRKSTVSEQLGKGHSHSPVKGTTVLEFQVRVADFAKGGKLPIIMANGRSADLVSRHLRFASTTLTF